MVDERAYKSPVIAQAITQCLDRWLTQQDLNNTLTYHNGEGTANTYVDGPVNLDELGKHIAAQLGF